MAEPAAAPPVAIIMGSQSDWETMHHAAETLSLLGIGHEARIMSAHRTPDRMADFAREARGRGVKVIIAGAGGSAHLPGMTAAMTPLPVLGVPVESKALKGMDSLLSIVQMPGGIPVGTLAIGRAGAINAALLAAAILALSDPVLAGRLDAWRAAQTAGVPESAFEPPDHHTELTNFLAVRRDYLFNLRIRGDTRVDSQQPRARRLCCLPARLNRSRLSKHRDSQN